ncbi:TetR family transcriptional regulator, partial [Pseudolysinimonas sp.]
MSTRDYHSPRRQAEAAATRARIVEAAGRLFVAHGYVATPIKAIAEAAGVSVPTVHLNGPKHALLIAA